MATIAKPVPTLYEIIARVSAGENQVVFLKFKNKISLFFSWQKDRAASVSLQQREPTALRSILSVLLIHNLICQGASHRVTRRTRWQTK